MARPSITHAWDHFWDRTKYEGLHNLGAAMSSAQTPAKTAWACAVTELQEAGDLNIRQIEALAELICRTKAVVEERIYGTEVI